MLTQPKNMELLNNLSGQWVDKVRQRKPLKQIILDMDSSVSPTYGNQEGTAYNDIFNAPVITRCFVSISLVIWSKLFFAMEMFIVPTTGRAFWNPSSPVTDPLASRGFSEGMLVLQILRFIVSLNLKITPMRYG